MASSKLFNFANVNPSKYQRINSFGFCSRIDGISFNKFLYSSFLKSFRRYFEVSFARDLLVISPWETILFDIFISLLTFFIFFFNSRNLRFFGNFDNKKFTSFSASEIEPFFNFFFALMKTWSTWQFCLWRSNQNY